jgi:calcineurin-like phosphoesterase family protein
MYKFKTFVLCHFPIQSWDGLNKGHIHLHGHVHLPTNLRFGKGKKMDVGMDGHPTFGVYDMDDIIRIMDKREIASDMLFDHHTDEVITEDGKKRK